jgi:hypothetical protein
MSRKRSKNAALVKQAVDYLSSHDFALTWDFSATDPPSQAIRRLVTPYFADGEIEVTTSNLVSEYLVRRLREDHLPMDTRRRSGRDPWSRRPTCRVVCDDE